MVSGGTQKERLDRREQGWRKKHPSLPVNVNPSEQAQGEAGCFALEFQDLGVSSLCPLMAQVKPV